MKLTLGATIKKCIGFVLLNWLSLGLSECLGRGSSTPSITGTRSFSESALIIVINCAITKRRRWSRSLERLRACNSALHVASTRALLRQHNVTNKRQISIHDDGFPFLRHDANEDEGIQSYKKRNGLKITFYLSRLSRWM